MHDHVNTPHQQIRVVLLDQHVLIRGALRTLLEHQPQFVVVAEEAPGATAVRVVAARHPHIIVLNPLPVTNTLDLIPALLAAADQARVVVLTDPQDTELPRQAILRGAMGIVPKDQSPATLVTAITKVHDGELWADRRLLAQVLMEQVRDQPSRTVDPEHAKMATLTTREREVIMLLGRG